MFIFRLLKFKINIFTDAFLITFCRHGKIFYFSGTRQSMMEQRASVSLRIKSGCQTYSCIICEYSSIRYLVIYIYMLQKNVHVISEIKSEVCWFRNQYFEFPVNFNVFIQKDSHLFPLDVRGLRRLGYQDLNFAQEPRCAGHEASRILKLLSTSAQRSPSKKEGWEKKDIHVNQVLQEHQASSGIREGWLLTL